MKAKVLLWMATALATALANSATGVLDESNRNLTSIPISYPSHITRLILHHNSITMSSSDVLSLSKLLHLTELDLSFNTILQLPDGAFSGLERLEVLNLSGNSLPAVRKETFIGLKELKLLDLQENPWNCDSTDLKLLLKWMSESGVRIEGGTCSSPENLKTTRILDLISTGPNSSTKPPTVPTSTTTHTTTATTTTRLPPPSPTTTAPPTTPTTTTAPPTTITTTTAPPTTPTTTTTGATAAPAKPALTTAQWIQSTLHKTNISNKDSLTETGESGKQEPGVSNTWKFLAGVIVIALCTSMFIVCAVKSPSWYKMLFNYRHQRLREEEPNVFSTGRYSNFSLDTEQTETSAYELDQNPEQQPEDEDGFIEDRYIQPEDYKEHHEDYKDHSDADEV